MRTEVMQETASLMHEIREACDLMSVPLDGLLKELAPGQYELNLHHVDNPLQATGTAMASIPT